jgi:hypothetical protein
VNISGNARFIWWRQWRHFVIVEKVIKNFLEVIYEVLKTAPLTPLKHCL